ncbi:MAG: MFS transporter [Bacteroidetes bacterium]|nr:MFS transporter [Bacteroidota bacterium]
MKNTFTVQQRVLLWLACSAIFFEAFDVSIVNLALPVIAADLHIPVAVGQWIQTIYLLSFGGFLLLGGRLCDYAGSKRIFLVGMATFGVASVLAAVSHHMWLLLPARAGQGIGAALAMPGGISLLSRHFKEEKQHRVAFGIFGAFAAVGFAGGLSLGGMVAAAFDWHWIFGINAPVILLVLITGSLYIPAEKVDVRTSLPVISSGWLTVTLLLLSYAIHESGNLGWRTLPCLAGAGVSIFFLLRFDRRQAQPFFERGIYSSSVAFKGLVAFFLLGCTFLSFIAISTLALYEVMGWGIQAAGWLLFPYSIGSALVSRWVLPVLFRRAGVARTALVAFCCLLAGALLLGAGIYTHRLPCYLAALLLVNSIAISIGYPALTILSLTGVAPDKQGLAAGLQSSINTIGSGIGLSVTGLCLGAFRSAVDVSLLYALGVVAIGCVIAVFQLSIQRRGAAATYQA